MKPVTPRGLLSKLHGDVWWAIKRAERLTRLPSAQSATRWDAKDIEQVLRVVLDQVYAALKRERGEVPNQRNIRQAEDFALKAQLAKARQAVAEVLNEREDGPSHK